MKTPRHPALVILLLTLLCACETATPEKEAAIRSDTLLALPPLATTSDDAKREFADGVRELDMNRDVEAYAHFERAIAADSSFALGELYAAYSSQSQESFLAHFARAEALAPKASAVERALIESRRKALDGDDEGVIALAQQNVKALPKNPRAWLALASAYRSVGQTVQERAAMDTAIAVGPAFSPAYLFRSFTFSQEEPRDLTKAEQDARKAVELEPTEALVYDNLGDALRAQGKLDEAGKAYTTCAEKDPTSGGCLQQRGHVNTFLAKYAEARADYDAAVQVAVGNQKPLLGQYRAFVYVHEGNPKAAVEELEKLYQSIDGLNIPEPTGLKIAVDSQRMAIANHYGMITEAQQSVDRRAQLMQTMADKANTPEARRSAAAAKALDAGDLALAKSDYATATAKANEYMKIREPDRNPNKNRLAHDLLGMIAVKQNKYADAVREFEQGVPEIINFNYYHAVALEGLGRKNEAQKLYAKVANFYFNHVSVGFVRKDALAKVKGTAS